MMFPRKRMRLTLSFKGRTDPDGWIELDISGMDMDGIKKVYLPVADLKVVQERGNKEVTSFKDAQALLSLLNEDEEE